MTVLYEVRHADGTILKEGPQTCFSAITHYYRKNDSDTEDVTSIKYWPMPCSSLTTEEVNTYLSRAATIIPELRHTSYEDLIRGFTISGKLPGQYINFIFKILRLLHEVPEQVRAVVRMCDSIQVRLSEEDPWGHNKILSVRVPFPLALALSTEIYMRTYQYSKPIAPSISRYVHNYFAGYSRKLVANLMRGKKAYRGLESYRTAKYLYNGDKYDWDSLYGIRADSRRPSEVCDLTNPYKRSVTGLNIEETSIYDAGAIKKFIVDEVIHFYKTHTKPNAWNTQISPDFLAKLETYIEVVR